MTEFRLFGPVAVAPGADAGPPRQRLVLAALLVDAGQPVTPDTLIARVWGDEPPARARHALHTHLARIRKLLADVDPGADLILRSGAYVLQIEPGRVDLHRFQSLLRQAPGRPDGERFELLREALGWWRGEPLAGLAGPWVDQVRAAWQRERLDAATRWAQAGLDLGRPAELIGPLTDLTHEYPYAEALTGLLIRALHASGRTAEALECYADIRRRLVEDLGTEPGEDLRAAHQTALQGSTPPEATPDHLPTSVTGFVGRDDQLARLDARLPEGGAIVALSGTAGVGKTALAFHWARRVAGHFPDGQLHVNLRGFDPSGSAMTPAEAIRGFLATLGLPAERVPAHFTAQVSQYRSLVAERRMLIVLDNARDAEQVRPLLPGGRTSLVLVTSRNQLPGLVAADGAQPLRLDLPNLTEAKQLLAARLGAERMAAEPAAATEIVERCARLPLAIVIVAARAALRPGITLEALVHELGDAQGGLDAFDGPTDVRAVLSWSYHGLTEPAARLFRLLGPLPGPETSISAAASLAGVSPREARALLTELAQSHLVAEPSPGRYACHDLLRAYAAELPADRCEANRRLLDHYLHTAHGADALLDPAGEDFTVPPPVSATTVDTFDGYEPALAWFDDEHAVLLATLRWAADQGFDRQLWQLARAMSTYFHRRGHRHDWAASQTAALAAASRLGDRVGEAYAHRDLARANARLGNYDQAHHHYGYSLRQLAELGHHLAHANAHLGLSWVLERQADPHGARSHAQQALTGYEAAADPAGQARALNAVGWYDALLGEYDQALLHCGRALDLNRSTGDRPGQADTWDSIAYAHHQRGDHAKAVHCYQQALDLYRDLGDSFAEADTLTRLADTFQAQGSPAEARTAWNRALALLDRLNHPNASTLRAKLATDPE